MSEERRYSVVMRHENDQFIGLGHNAGSTPEEAMQAFLKTHDDFMPFNREIRYKLRVEENTYGGFPDYTTFTGTIDELLNRQPRVETVDGIH